MVVPPWKWYCHECGVWLCHPGSGAAMSVAYGCATLEVVLPMSVAYGCATLEVVLLCVWRMVVLPCKWCSHECGVWLCHPGSATAMSVAYGCATLEVLLP